MLINISHCLFPDCHHYPSSETFRPGAQAMLCCFAWLELRMGNCITNCKGHSVQKGAGRQGKSFPPDFRNVSAVKRSFTESRSERSKNLLTHPMKIQLDLEVLNAFPRGGRHGDTCSPGEKESGGKATVIPSLHFTFTLSEFSFCTIWELASECISCRKPSKGNR